MLKKSLIGGLVLMLLAACGPHVYRSGTVNQSLPQLTVQAEATVKARPDMLQMRLGVVTEALSADDALAENNLRMQSLMGMLENIGLTSAEYATGQFQIRPEWSVPPRPTPANWRREIVAYRVSNDLVVETGKIELAGDLLGLAQKSGANQVGGLQFGLADPEKYRQQAIAEATRTARLRAQTLAEAAGARLGPIVSLSFNAFGAYPAPRLMKMEGAMAADAAAVPVAAGNVDVQAGVSIVYRLDDSVGGH